PSAETTIFATQACLSQRPARTRLLLGRPLCRLPGDEDELEPGPVGGVPDLVDDQGGRGQRVGELTAAAEPERGVRGQHRAIAVEDEGRPERDQVPLDLGQVYPRLDGAGVRDDGTPVG